MTLARRQSKRIHMCGTCKFHRDTRLPPMVVCEIPDVAVPVAYTMIKGRQTMSMDRNEPHRCPCWEKAY